VHQSTETTRAEVGVLRVDFTKLSSTVAVVLTDSAQVADDGREIAIRY
jgi:hypothetical protein